MLIKAAVLTPLASQWEWREVEPHFESHQKIVGGYIELIRITPKANLYCNEDGLELHLPKNVAWHNEGQIQAVLMGTLLAVGPCDGKGNDTSLSQEGLDALMAHLRLIRES